MKPKPYFFDIIFNVYQGTSHYDCCGFIVFARSNTWQQSEPKPYFLRTDRNHKILKMPVRPEKVEEIKAVWDSPKFKTNAQRLVHLLRHCRRIEYGYTIREFAHAIFPDKMDTDPKEDDGWDEIVRFKEYSSNI